MSSTPSITVERKMMSEFDTLIPTGEIYKVFIPYCGWKQEKMYGLLQMRSINQEPDIKKVVVAGKEIKKRVYNYNTMTGFTVLIDNELNVEYPNRRFEDRKGYALQLTHEKFAELVEQNKKQIFDLMVKLDEEIPPR
jgi:hypothetical protein